MIFKERKSKSHSKSHSKRNKNFKKDEIFKFDATHEGLGNQHNSDNENKSARSYRTGRENANDINPFSFSGEAKVF